MIGENPFKAKKGEKTCDTCSHFMECEELNNGSVRMLKGCRICKCYDEVKSTTNAKQKQIEEIKQVLIKTCKRCRSSAEDYMQSNYAEALYNAGYRKVGEYKAEIAKLKSEINDYKQRYKSSEKRYFETTQSGCESLRAKDEHFKKKVRKIVGTVAKIMIEQFGDEPPCNFNDNAKYMYENDNKFCDEHCDAAYSENNYEQCWVEFLKAKMKKYGVR